MLADVEIHKGMSRWLARLDDLDVRWFYGALLLCIVLAAFIRVPVKIQPSREARGFFEAVEKLDGSKPVLIHSDWDQGTIGELRAQFRGVVRHLFQKNVRFVIVSGIQTGRQFYEPVVNELAQEFGKEYGRDWVAFGYKVPDPKGIAIEALSRDFSAQVKMDDLGRPVSAYPWLAKTRVAEDWALVVCIAYTPYLEYLTYFQAAAKVPLVCGMASISSTNLYPYFTAGTMKGMLVGARGGGEYEQQLGISEFGTRFLLGQSAGHIILLLAVIIGNVGAIALKTYRRKQPI